MVRTEQQIYKAIADVVSRAAPSGWQKIFVTTTIGDDTGEAIYDYVGESGEQTWFAPETLGQYEVYTAFKELHSAMKATGHSWVKSRFTLEPTGKFHVDFEYA